MPSPETDFDTLIDAALAEPVSGWRFPFLDGRRTSDDLAWDYPAIARELVRRAGSVLDHGTGGGEADAAYGRVARARAQRGVQLGRDVPDPQAWRSMLTQMGRTGERRPGEVGLTDLFPGGKVNDWPRWSLTEHLTSAGFVIEEYREHLARTHFLDIGAFVYFLRTVPWAIPDFTVAGYREHLLEMHEHIRSHGSLVTATTGIFALATKPATGRTDGQTA